MASSSPAVVGKQSRGDEQQRCLVVGIAGPSGCGKSTLAQSLVDQFTKLPSVHASLFPEDPRYFRAPKSKSYRDANPESETPSFTHWDQYVTDLHQCLESKFTSNVDSASTVDDDKATTTTIWIVDHFLLMHDQRVVEMLDMLIFLDPCMDIKDDFMEELANTTTPGTHDAMTTTTPESYIPSCTPEVTWAARNVCRERRVQRDPNRPAEEQDYLRQYYNHYVWPAYLYYTHGPARRYLQSCKINQNNEQTTTLQINSLTTSQDQVLTLAVDFVQKGITSLDNHKPII